MAKECVKKQYSREEADEELNRLNAEHSEFYWYGFNCKYCGQWHIEREEKA